MRKIAAIVTILVLISITGTSQDKKTPQFWFEKGEQALARKEYVAARAHFSECLRLDNRFADAYRLRAISQEHLGENERALTDYNIYVELKPEDPEALFSRGVLRFEANQFLPARQDFLKVLRAPKGETNTVYFGREKYNESNGKIFTAQNGGKDYVYNYLGLIETKLKRYDVAIGWLDSAVKNSPNNASYLINRGSARLDKNDKAGAKADFENALKLEPDNSLAIHNLATLKAAAGEKESSELLLSEAIERNKNLPYPRADRAFQRMQKNDLAGALEDYNEVVKLEPRDYENYLNRGLVKEKMKDLQGALVDFSKAIELNDKDERSWLSRGNIMSKLARWKDAIEDYSVAIAHNPNYGLAFYNRAVANQHSGKLKEACDDLNKAIKFEVKVDVKMRDKVCR
ncbi:hypothetical protein BH10BAC4_BH10BAC4_22760 [soil metagenome]